jgi:hypothetical protein
MNRVRTNAIVAASLFLAFSAAQSWAQLPPTNDKSDGFSNTGGGTGALSNITGGGVGNTAYGESALGDDTTGSQNVAVGLNALEQNTTGSFNTASGVDALFSNNASDNTAVGYQALTLNTSGNQNTAVGFNALEDNSTGVDNTAIGYQALPNNSTGSTTPLSDGRPVQQHRHREYRNRAVCHAG